MSCSADGGGGPSVVELSEWEIVNRILGRHGCGAVHVSPGDVRLGGVILDPQASLALRTAIRTLVDDTERRQNLIQSLIQVNSHLKDDVRLQQDRAGRQQQRAEELQHILDGIKAKIRELEDDFLCKTREQQSEVARLRAEQEAELERCQKQEETLRAQEQSIAQLRARITRAEATEQRRPQSRIGPQRNNHLHQQRSQSSEGLTLDGGLSEGSLDLDTTPNYKALIKSYQEQIQQARRKEEALQRENDRLQREVENRPSAREFRVYKQQKRKMEKILTHNNLRYRGVTAGKEAEPDTGVKGVELLPHGECQRYLQHVCRELGVQDVKNLLAVAAVRVREAGTCCALQKILSAISGVISGPRAPPLLYKHSSRLQETRGPDILDESHFLHLPPTIELWAGELRALQMLHRSLRKLNVTLQPQLQGDRTEEAAGAGVRVQELLLLVDTMVEDVENQRQGSSSDSPQVLQPLVSHFQKLFDVSSLSGVFPRMNEVYTKVGEMGNALKTLRCLLGLGATARAEVVVSAVGRLCREMDGGSCRLPQMLSTLDIDSVINKVQEHEEFFPAFEELIRDLLDVLEITHLEEILPEVRRLKQLEMQGLVLLES